MKYMSTVECISSTTCLQWIVFHEIQGVWKCGYILSSVFDIIYLPTSKLKLRRKLRNKIIKLYAKILRSEIQTLS